jgi:hypothetical protein
MPPETEKRSGSQLTGNPRQMPAVLFRHGSAYGSIPMAAYTLGAKCPTESGDTRPSAGLPDPSVVPPVNTNA